MSTNSFKDAMKAKTAGTKKPLDNLLYALPDETDKIFLVSSSKLIINDDQAFSLHNDEQLQALAERIKRCGLINAISIRPANDDNYEVITGRNRVRAVMLNGDKEIKAIIYNVDDDTTKLMIIDENLGQREHILPSEKAKAYKDEAEILYRRGKRPGESLSNGCTNLDTHRIIGEKHSESRSTVFNYIRLTYLIPELLKLVDDKKLQFIVGVELSHLDENTQKHLLDKYISQGVKLSKDKVGELRNLAKENRLDEHSMAFVLENKKPKTTTFIKFKRDSFSEFSDIIDKEPDFEAFIINLLRAYKTSQACN